MSDSSVCIISKEGGEPKKLTSPSLAYMLPAYKITAESARFGDMLITDRQTDTEIFKKDIISFTEVNMCLTLM